jgi:hypothetical protein
MACDRQVLGRPAQTAEEKGGEKVSFRMELEDLPPRYRAQAEMQIAQRKSERCLQKGTKSGKNCERNEQKREIQVKNGSFCEQSTKRVPESEKRYYREVILPKVACGQIVKVQEQVVFDLLPEKAYCGLKLPKARYKPDFVLTYADGTVEIVEVKSKFTRRMQRDYIYRRRLFIDLVAEPRGWKFTEWFADKED